MARLLIYLVEILLLAYILRRAARALSHFFSGEPRLHVWSWQSGAAGRSPREVIQGQTVRDSVCGMFVSTELSQRLTAGDRTLHFCSRDCLEVYQKTHA